MSKNLSDFDYSFLTVDPDVVDVPVSFDLSPIPRPTKISSIIHVDEGCKDSEPLVEIIHPLIKSVPTYWIVGWEEAVEYVVVRSGVAEALVNVAESLPVGFGLLIFDAWRPLSLQREIYDAAYADESLPAGFVNEPSLDPRTPPPHSTGGTVDLTLTWHDSPLALGTFFDDFTELAHPDYFENTPGKVRELRRLLFWSMRSQSFIVNSMEWWHYELGTREWAQLSGEPVWYSGTTPL